MDSLQTPVFILGLHRSGTTLLYEMLTASGYWNSLWAWHVIEFDQLLLPDLDLTESQAGLARRFESLGIHTRGVDVVGIRPSTVEEYGFILDNHGFGLEVRQKNLHFFREICTTVQRTHDEHRPLLLKNPWDYCNAHRIKQLIPAARFVIIYRSPLEVLSSMWRFAIKAVVETMPYVAMLSHRYDKLLHSRWRLAALRYFMTRQPKTVLRGLVRWVAVRCKLHQRSIAQIPVGDRVEVHFDDLCASPTSSMHSIFEQLNMPQPDCDYSSMIGPRSMKLADLVENDRPFIEKRLSRYSREEGSVSLW